MKHNDVLELIDQFLLGRITEHDLSRLEILRKANPVIDTEVREGIEVMKVLKYMRYKQLREKLHALDIPDDQKGSQFRFPGWIAGIIMLTLLFFGTGWWAVDYFDPASIAHRYFNHFSVEHVLQFSNRDETNKFLMGIKEFNEGNFENAIAVFQQHAMPQNDSISVFVSWDILLARLAVNGPDHPWVEDFNDFMSTAPEPLKTEARHLNQLVNSPWYHFFWIQLSPQLSSLKPRLM
ncbi:MAG: hypothetical protein ABIQ02_14575 [Saprospiraceae bacterium]